ncbi:MAG: hypothetical protein ACFFAH_09780 [Promethearchaeota archaeon]
MPNSSIFDNNKAYDTTPIRPSEQSDLSIDNTPTHLSASAPKYNQTFTITQSKDDAYSGLGLTGNDGNLFLGGHSDPSNSWNTGVGLRWDITVPIYAHITKAYIYLTVATLDQPFLIPYNGFNTSIHAFYEYSTNDFSDTEEDLKDRPVIGNILWELNGTELINQTLKTADISDLIQQIIILDGWDGIFGAWITPNIGTELLEFISFWSYDTGNSTQFPELFIEWDYTPHFTDTPEDKYVIENAPRYSLKWQIWDDNPDTFEVTCNVSILGVPYYNTWSSGWVTYDLPALEKNIYNFTIYFNDTDGYLIWDSLIIEAGPAQMTYKIDRSEDDAWYQPVEGAAFTEYGNILQLGGSNSKKNEDQRVICLRFNTDIPKHVRIKRAYVNLTVNSVSNYDGFTSEIHMFYPPVLDFSNEYDNDLFTLVTMDGSFRGPMLLYRRTSDSSVTWTLPGGLSEGNTIQTPDFTSELQELIDFGNYNGYIGLYIIPTAGVDYSTEKINNYSYDGAIAPGETQNIPILFVEWEESPYFESSPADITAKKGIRGYHLDWTATDDNPTTFTITCNRTVSNIPYEGVWQSGVENSYNWFYRTMETSTTKIRFDLPPLDIGVYNFTIRINDAYGNYNFDSVIINVKDLDLPVLTNIKFIQNGKEVNYFQCGNGPFTIKIYNSTPIEPGLWLTAYYPEYEQIIYSDTTIGGIYFPLEISVSGDTISALKYGDSSFNYKSFQGCFEFECPPSSRYQWLTVAASQMPTGSTSEERKYVNDIEYNILNRFEFRVNGNAEYIYNQTIYGGIWAHPIEVWNRDLTPPTFLEPTFIKPDEPDKHYEVNIWAGTEVYGAEVDKVFLYYSVDDNPWEESEMILKDGKYYAEIPAQEEGSTIDYYIKITDVAGNSIETEEYHEKAPIFEEPSIIIPIVGIFLGILGSLSIVAIHRHKRKVAIGKHISEKSPKKSKKGLKIGNKLLQKIKKVRKK